MRKVGLLLIGFLLLGSKAWAQPPYSSNLGGGSGVPYTGATGDVNLGVHGLSAGSLGIGTTGAGFSSAGAATATSYASTATDGNHFLNVNNTAAHHTSPTPAEGDIDSVAGVAYIYHNSAWSAIGGGTIGGSTGSTDNRVLRADGTGGTTIQSSGVTIDDSNNVTGAASYTTPQQTSTTPDSVLWRGYGTNGRGFLIDNPASEPANTITMHAPTMEPTAGDCLVASAFSSHAGQFDWVAKISATPPSAIDGSAEPTLTAAQMSDPRCSVTNYGMTDADHYVNLPTVAANLSCLFNVGTARAHKWGVKAGASDTIYLIGSDGSIAAGSDNGYARFDNTVVGQSFACWSFTTGSGAWDWQCKAISVGTGRTFAAN